MIAVGLFFAAVALGYVIDIFITVFTWVGLFALGALFLLALVYPGLPMQEMRAQREPKPSRDPWGYRGPDHDKFGRKIPIGDPKPLLSLNALPELRRRNQKRRQKRERSLAKIRAARGFFQL